MNGRLYLMGTYNAGGSFGQSLFITPMSNPYTLSDARVRLSSPTLSWERQTGAVAEGPEPLYHNGRTFANGVYAPGHNGFFKSPDGTEDWIVYHANDSAGGGCDMNRSTRARKFTWNADGTPNFGTPGPPRRHPDRTLRRTLTHSGVRRNAAFDEM
ncbi:family 43 glycosylhydrolase [Actinomycetes bacterium KLBMP 9797]